MSEQQAKEALYEILVGRARYMDVTNGYAIGEENGPANVVVEQGMGKTLVCRIVRPHAALLVQQIVYSMNTGKRDSMLRTDSQVIHPSLCEVVINASANMAPPGHVHVHQTRPVRQALAAMEGVSGHFAAQET